VIALRSVLLIVAAAFVFATAAGSATSYEQPAWVDQEATVLAPVCGGLRAELIARMDYARSIHAWYIGAVARDPKLAAEAGDANWHRYWVDTYRQTIVLLRAGCAS
jgi:hypothetical protein